MIIHELEYRNKDYKIFKELIENLDKNMVKEVIIEIILLILIIFNVTLIEKKLIFNYLWVFLTNSETILF